MSGNPLTAKFQSVFLRSDIGLHFTVQYLVNLQTRYPLAFSTTLYLPCKEIAAKVLMR